MKWWSGNKQTTQQHFGMLVPCTSHESGVMCHGSELPGTVPWHSSIDLIQKGIFYDSWLFHVALLRYFNIQPSFLRGGWGYKQPWMLSRTKPAPYERFFPTKFHQIWRHCISLLHRFWLPRLRRDLPRRDESAIKHGEVGWLKHVKTPSSINIHPCFIKS